MFIVWGDFGHVYRQRETNGQRSSVDDGRETSSSMRENMGSCTGFSPNEGKDDFLKVERPEKTNKYPDRFDADGKLRELTLTDLNVSILISRESGKRKVHLDISENWKNTWNKSFGESNRNLRDKEKNCSVQGGPRSVCNGMK